MAQSVEETQDTLVVAARCEDCKVDGPHVVHIEESGGSVTLTGCCSACGVLTILEGVADAA